MRKIIIGLILFILIIPLSLAVTQGANSPSTASDTTGVGTITWSNPTNIFSDDTSNATAGLTPSTTSHYLNATNFRFNIPSNSIITGILVQIKRHASSTANGGVKDNQVYIVQGGVIKTTVNLANATAWGLTGTHISYGNSTYLWNQTWTAEQINNAGFGVVLSATKGAGGSGTWTASVNHIMITVYYTSSYIPPTPVISTVTTGAFWVNTSWTTGAGNITNSYNVSMEGVGWTNDSATPYMNSTLSPGAWHNLTIYAYNTSALGMISTTPLINNTQAPVIDTSFTVTIPIGQTMMNFTPPNSTAKIYYPNNQTATIPFFNITNNGNIAQTFKFYVNATISNIDLYADLDNSHSSGTIPINTTTTTVIVSNLGIGSSQNIWMYANFSHAIPQNTNRLLTINSS